MATNTNTTFAQNMNMDDSSDEAFVSENDSPSVSPRSSAPADAFQGPPAGSETPAPADAFLGNLDDPDMMALDDADQGTPAGSDVAGPAPPTGGEQLQPLDVAGPAPPTGGEQPLPLVVAGPAPPTGGEQPPSPVLGARLPSPTGDEQLPDREQLRTAELLAGMQEQGAVGPSAPQMHLQPLPIWSLQGSNAPQMHLQPLPIWSLQGSNATLDPAIFGTEADRLFVPVLQRPFSTTNWAAGAAEAGQFYENWLPANQQQKKDSAEGGAGRKRKEGAVTGKKRERIGPIASRNARSQADPNRAKNATAVEVCKMPDCNGALMYSKQMQLMVGKLPLNDPAFLYYAHVPTDAEVKAYCTTAVGDWNLCFKPGRSVLELDPADQQAWHAAVCMKRACESETHTCECQDNGQECLYRKNTARSWGPSGSTRPLTIVLCAKQDPAKPNACPRWAKVPLMAATENLFLGVEGTGARKAYTCRHCTTLDHNVACCRMPMTVLPAETSEVLRRLGENYRKNEFVIRATQAGVSFSDLVNAVGPQDTPLCVLDEAAVAELKANKPNKPNKRRKTSPPDGAAAAEPHPGGATAEPNGQDFALHLMGGNEAENLIEGDNANAIAAASAGVTDEQRVAAAADVSAAYVPEEEERRRIVKERLRFAKEHLAAEEERRRVSEERRRVAEERRRVAEERFAAEEEQRRRVAEERRRAAEAEYAEARVAEMVAHAKQRGDAAKERLERNEAKKRRRAEAEAEEQRLAAAVEAASEFVDAVDGAADAGALASDPPRPRRERRLSLKAAENLAQGKRPRRQ